METWSETLSGYWLCSSTYTYEQRLQVQLRLQGHLVVRVRTSWRRRLDILILALFSPKMLTAYSPDLILLVQKDFSSSSLTNSVALLLRLNLVLVTYTPSNGVGRRRIKCDFLELLLFLLLCLLQWLMTALSTKFLPLLLLLVLLVAACPTAASAS